jgi:N-succinyldiaminopimelate aminotransferase
MNPDMSQLQPYPFERLAALFRDITPPAGLDAISLSIGEPRHATPGFITEEVITHLHGLSRYPLTRGQPELRSAIADWLTARFQLAAGSLDPERHVLPVNGTREALFAFAQCTVDRSKQPLVLMPNPFYQIYEGAALLAGAQPWFMNTTRDSGYLPDLDAVPDDVWQRCQLVYICSPGNPTGAVMGIAQLQQLLQLADEHDFVIASDECYSEIYLDETAPPPGLLQAADVMGRDDFSRCMVFHSLSKRYRTYHGCAMPPATQAASICAWRDESHVVKNRSLYREKITAVLDILSPVMDVSVPDAGFYLWPHTPGSDTRFAHDLQAQQHVTVLPGSFLSRSFNGSNPGADHARLALVAPLEDCLTAATRIRSFLG